MLTVYRTTNANDYWTMELRNWELVGIECYIYDPLRDIDNDEYFILSKIHYMIDAQSSLCFFGNIPYIGEFVVYSLYTYIYQFEYISLQFYSFIFIFS